MTSIICYNVADEPRYNDSFKFLFEKKKKTIIYKVNSNLKVFVLKSEEKNMNLSLKKINKSVD